MRDILLGGHSLSDLPTGWGLGWLLARPLIPVGVGVALFTRFERLAGNRGTLGRYQEPSLRGATGIRRKRAVLRPRCGSTMVW